MSKLIFNGVESLNIHLFNPIVTIVFHKKTSDQYGTNSQAHSTHHNNEWSQPSDRKHLFVLVALR